MQIWEYLLLRVDNEEGHGLWGEKFSFELSINGAKRQKVKSLTLDEYDAYVADMIGKLGNDGWELVSTANLKLVSTMIFKRPKQES